MHTQQADTGGCDATALQRPAQDAECECAQRRGPCPSTKAPSSRLESRLRSRLGGSTRRDLEAIPTADHVEKEAARCGVKMEVVDWIQAEGEHHLLHERCPRHRGAVWRWLRFATQDLYEAKNPGSVINNCGGFAESAVPEFDGPRPGIEVKAETHDVQVSMLTS